MAFLLQLVALVACAKATPITELSAFPRSWLSREFAKPAEVISIVNRLNNADFGPCEKQRVRNSGKECVQLTIQEGSDHDLVERFGNLFHVDVSGFSSFAAVRYLPGSMPSAAHVDHYADGTPADLTILIYLDDADANTTFPFAQPPFSVAPRAGTLLAWMNVDEEGFEDPAARHSVDAYHPKEMQNRMILQFSITLRDGQPSCPPAPAKWPHRTGFDPLRNSSGPRAACSVHVGDDKYFPTKSNPFDPHEVGGAGASCVYRDDCEDFMACGCACPHGDRIESACHSCSCGLYNCSGCHLRRLFRSKTEQIVTTKLLALAALPDEPVSTCPAQCRIGFD